MRTILAGAVLLLALSGCVTTDEPEGPSLASQKMATWQVCVGTATGTNRRTMTDASLAVELAFVSCQTEENAIVALFDDAGGQAEAARLIAERRATMKAELIAMPLK